MAYRDDILALNPDHYWTWDGNHNDIGVGPSAPKNTNQAGGNTATLIAPGISEDANQGLNIPTITARSEAADSGQMNLGSHPQRTMGGWFMAPAFTDSITHIYKEGGGTNNITIWMFPGNFIMCQAIGTNVNPDINKQVFGDRQMTPGRAYHLCFRFIGNDDFWFYIDGVQQPNSVGDVGTANNFPSHGADIVWGDSDTALRMGASLNFAGLALIGSRLNHWASWTAALDQATQIRQILFERGALPTHTVTSQAELDALANSTISETPLAIRIDVAGNIDLDANNILFENSSIDIQYTGTGTLNWTNGGTSNAAIVSTTNGGTVNILEVISITITVTDVLKNPIIGARVYAYYEDDPTTPIISDTTNALGVVQQNADYLGDKNLIGWARSHNLSGVDYETKNFTGVVTSAGLTTIAQLDETQ